MTVRGARRAEPVQFTLAAREVVYPFSWVLPGLAVLANEARFHLLARE